MRYQDTENEFNSNQRSVSYHLSGLVDKHGIRQEFCTKIDTNSGSGDWPSGQYCIYKFGTTCPLGLKEGEFQKSFSGILSSSLHTECYCKLSLRGKI